MLGFNYVLLTVGTVTHCVEAQICRSICEWGVSPHIPSLYSRQRWVIMCRSQLIYLLGKHIYWTGNWIGPRPNLDSAAPGLPVGTLLWLHSAVSIVLTICICCLVIVHLSIRFRMQEHTNTWNIHIRYGTHPVSYTMGIEGEGDRNLKLNTQPN